MHSGNFTGIFFLPTSIPLPLRIITDIRNSVGFLIDFPSLEKSGRPSSGSRSCIWSNCNELSRLLTSAAGYMFSFSHVVVWFHMLGGNWYFKYIVWFYTRSLVNALKLLILN